MTLTTTALNGSSSRRFEGCVWTLPLISHTALHPTSRHWMHSWHTYAGNAEIPGL
ncbi:hypothetical protein ACVTKO_004164 [Shigella flexneri]